MSSPIIQVYSTGAPLPKGPYSQAVFFENLMFLSGQLSLDYNGEPVEGDIVIQTNQAIDNLDAILREENIGLDRILMTFVYLAKISDLDAFNSTYGSRINIPARATAGSGLPDWALVEIAAIAAR